MSDQYVPYSVEDVDLLVDFVIFFQIDTRRGPHVRVRKGAIVFDFMHALNKVGMPDLVVPLKPGKESQARVLVESYLQYVGGESLKPGFRQLFFNCVDTSKYDPAATVRTMDKMERAIRRIKDPSSVLRE